MLNHNFVYTHWLNKITMKSKIKGNLKIEHKQKTACLALTAEAFCSLTENSKQNSRVSFNLGEAMNLKSCLQPKLVLKQKTKSVLAPTRPLPGPYQAGWAAPPTKTVIRWVSSAKTCLWKKRKRWPMGFARQARRGQSFNHLFLLETHDKSSPLMMPQLKRSALTIIIIFCLSAILLWWKSFSTESPKGLPDFFYAANEDHFRFQTPEELGVIGWTLISHICKLIWRNSRGYFCGHSHKSISFYVLLSMRRSLLSSRTSLFMPNLPAILHSGWFWRYHIMTVGRSHHHLQLDCAKVIDGDPLEIRRLSETPVRRRWVAAEDMFAFQRHRGCGQLKEQLQLMGKWMTGCCS